MAFEIRILNIALPAGADLTGKRFFAVGVDANGKAVLAGAGAPVIGVLQTEGKVDQAVAIMVAGVSPFVVGAAVTAGDSVASDADGKAAKAVTGNEIIGTALSSAGGAGEQISLLIEKRGIK